MFDDILEEIVFSPIEPKEYLYLPDNINVEMVGTPQMRKLAIFYSKSIDLKKPIIIFCHANAGISEHIFYMIEKMPNLILWDYSGTGRSSGSKPTITHAIEDLTSIMEWVQMKFQITTRDIILWGESLGSNLIWHCLSNINSNFWPKKIILLRPFDKLSCVLRHTKMVGKIWPLVKLTHDLNILPVYDKYNGKILIIGSENDETTPWKCCEKLHNRKPNNSELFDVGGYHNNLFVNFKLIENFV